MSDDLKERLRERWLELSRSSFDSQDAGISANLVDETIDRIEALEAQLACKGDVKACSSDVPCSLGALSRIERLEAQLEEARKALEPFAKEAATHGDQIPDQMFIWDYAGKDGGKNDIRVGDLRRAAAALHKDPSTESGSGS